MLKHFVEDVLQTSKALVPVLFWHLLVEPQVLEPKRAVLDVVVEALFANGERLLDVSFPFFILGRFEVHRPVVLAFGKKALKYFTRL